MSLEEAVDPEEAFVAALASCHMLFFLSLAAKAGLIVDEYVDEAQGTMASIEGRFEWRECSFDRASRLAAMSCQPMSSSGNSITVRTRPVI